MAAPATPPASASPSCRSTAVVMAVQPELARLGFDPGPADGLPGRRTDAALDAFLASTEPPLPADLPPIEILAELVRRPAA